MLKIKNQYEENGHLITEYENGAIIKSLISEAPPNLGDIEQPTNPILELQKENAELKAQIDSLNIAMANIMGV